MAKKLLAVLAALALMGGLAACGEKPLLDPKDPTELIMWHVYGEQAGSPMDELVDEFNRTTGRETGVLVRVMNVTSTAKIGKLLLDAQRNDPNSLPFPDIFTCHIGDALALGQQNILDWNDSFTPEELAEFVPGFLEDGMQDGRLLIFPISKSTHMLMMTGPGFDRFSAATGVTEEDLATWEGFYAAAAEYYQLTGLPFCALDYPLRAVELNAMEHGAEDFYTEDGWYDFENLALKESWLQFARALVQGHVVVSDLYSNTQVMTGEVLSGMGSSAAILYYNDVVTYEDGHSEPMDLRVLPMPCTAGAQPLMTQAGVGLCAYKTTPEKAEAAKIFAHWLTEAERNLTFVTDTGYMPVRQGAFDAIDSYEFSEESYARLYAAMKDMEERYTPVSEPRFTGYFGKVNAMYNGLRQLQKEMPARVAAGEDVDALALEVWEYFKTFA